LYTRLSAAEVRRQLIELKGYRGTRNLLKLVRPYF